MLEKTIQNQIFAKLCKGSIRLFRNNVGLGLQGKVEAILEGAWVLLKPFRRIKFGFFNGSSDLLGWNSIEITQDMVGKKVAVFLAIEVKVPGENPTKEQANFLEQVKNAGGYALVCTNAEEAEEGVKI